MTIEELKEHCVRQITEFERIKEIMPVTPNGYKRYEEHKIVLQLIEALEQEPCDDCISRQAAIDAFERFIHELGIEDEPYNYGEMALSVQNVPPVTPKEKTGHWIVDWSATSRLNRDRSLTYEYHVHCDSCGYRWDYTTDKKGSLVSNYCPNCGARMVESEE